MEKIFKLKENGTTARTEIVAGLTTFMTMAYIIALNPNLLTNFATGTPLWNAVFMATCIASAIGMLVMAFAANKPFAMAPGMGLNSFFAVVVANIATFTGLSYEEAFPAAMCIILVEGVFFVILTLFSIREKIVEAIPFGIRIGILSHHKVKASVILGMLISCIVYWGGSFIFLDTNPFASLATASFVPPLGDMLDTTFFKFDFETFISIGWFTAVALIITFCMIDMFDTIGTLVGTAARANMLDKDGKMPKMKEALLADAVGTVAGACTGTSTVTTFIESGSGVEAGGRTGLTALTTAVMFLLCMFIAPIAALIPAPATSAALIYVGILMLSGLKNVDWDDILQVIPVALMLIFMPITGSIGHGIGMALISYSVVAAFTGKAKEVSILTYVLSALFLAKFFIIV